MIALEARSLRKSFGPAEVLRGASLALHEGEVHVLAGGNGAGKSTLIKILSGVHADYEGELLLSGTPRRFSDPLAARRAGIATIHQELSLVGPLSVADNLLLSREPRSFAFLDRRRARAEALRILASFALDLDPDVPVESLPIATQQLLEIAKALAADARVLILDEPTSALDDAEAHRLLTRVESLRRQNRAILYVSHRMEEIYRLADRITVLRDGAVITTTPDLPQDELIHLMLGPATPNKAPPSPTPPQGHSKREPTPPKEDIERGPTLEAGGGGGREGGRAEGGRTGGAPSLGRAGGEPPESGAPLSASPSAGLDAANPRLEIDALSVPSLTTPHLLDLHTASFTVSPGEILAIAGLRGSGTSALLEALYGARPFTAARFHLDGHPARIRTPAEALHHRIAFLPADRQRAALIPALTLTENATLAALPRFTRGFFLDPLAERAALAAIAPQLALQTADPDAEAASLSGGTQQKVCLARCLLTAPRILLLDDPTRGVDVAAKADIHHAIRRLTRAGTAVLLASSELEEIIALADRALVLHRGRLVADLSREEATRERLLREAMGGAPS